MQEASYVLVVDPDAESRARIVRSLESRSFRCIEVCTAGAALDLAKSRSPALVVLDSVLPDVSGLGLCRLLRESSETSRVPILVVTHQSSEIDRVLAFEEGADDFLPKPFYPAELSARVAALLRGFESAGVPEPLPVAGRGAGLRVDRSSGVAILDDERLDLTPREFEILAVLAGQPGRVLRREQLIERVWGKQAPQSGRAIDAHIKSIRRKLGRARHRIETVRGVGYRFGGDAP